MINFKIDNGLSLLIEPHDKKLRLVITDGLTELACRKETPGNLIRFLSSTQSSLFKGRLQLHKNEDVVTVTLKGEPVGSVVNSELKNALNS